MGSNNKTILPFLLSLSLLLIVVACTRAQTPTGIEQSTPLVTEPIPPVETNSLPQATSTWRIDLNTFEIADDLSATESIQQYNGDVTQNQIQEKPAAGETFLLINLTIEKQIPGPSSFQWKNLTVEDGNGNSYSRHPNDTFLENYNFPRIKSTDLTIGKNEGFICFEIPIEITEGSLFLTYKSDEGDIHISLK